MRVTAPSLKKIGWIGGLYVAYDAAGAMPLPSAGPQRSVVGTGWPLRVTFAMTLTTYGLSAAIENAFSDRRPDDASAYSNCARQPEPSVDSETTEYEAAASTAVNAASSTPTVRGSGASAGA